MLSIYEDSIMSLCDEYEAIETVVNYDSYNELYY